MAPPGSATVAVENASHFVKDPTLHAFICFLCDDFSREKFAGKYGVVCCADLFQEERQFVTDCGLSSCRRFGGAARRRCESQNSRREEETTADRELRHSFAPLFMRRD
jgi:hypothetical protein